MKKCKQKLGVVWLIGSGAILLLFLWQTLIGGHYAGIESEAWSWLLPNLLPTLTLIISVWAVDAMGQSSQKKVDGFLFKVAMSLSIAYLFFVLITIIAAFVQSNPDTTPLDAMRNSHLWLVPINSLTIAMLGIFFVKKPIETSSKKSTP